MFTKFLRYHVFSKKQESDLKKQDNDRKNAISLTFSSQQKKSGASFQKDSR